MRRCSVTLIRRSWTGLADARQAASGGAKSRTKPRRQPRGCWDRRLPAEPASGQARPREGPGRVLPAHCPYRMPGPREPGSSGRRSASIEERAGAAGASAQSLSWLLPSGVVRNVPGLASGMPSRAGDPISSPGSLLPLSTVGSRAQPRGGHQAHGHSEPRHHQVERYAISDGRFSGEAGAYAAFGQFGAQPDGCRRPCRWARPGARVPWRQGLTHGGACPRRFPLGSPRARCISVQGPRSKCRVESLSTACASCRRLPPAMRVSRPAIGWRRTCFVFVRVPAR